MNVYDFFTTDELAEAPDDPALAFAQLVRVAQGRLRNATLERDERDEVDREFIEDARLGFISTIVSIAKIYNIARFESVEVPRHEDFNYTVHRQFQADLDHHIAQIVVGTALREKRSSIPISPEAKSRIRSHLHHIKEHLDRAEMTDAKRAALRAKLAEFEAGLEKDRLNLWSVGRVVLEILSVSANVLALSDSPTFQKLLSNLMVTVAVEKAADDENRRLPPIDPLPVTLPPRQLEDLGKQMAKGGPRENSNAGLDEEIPF